MIRLRLDVADVQRMRFAYSPRTEIAEILYRLHDTTAHPLLGSWLAGTRRVLHPPDVDLLRALAPARGNIANFLGPGAADTSTTVDDQLRFVSQCDPERLRDDLTRICRGLLPHDLQLELDANDLPKRAAEVRDTCWRLALEPPAPGCSPSSRPTSRTGMRRLVSGGLAAPLEDLHDVA